MATATLGSSGYTTDLRTGRHHLTADEPISSGGADAGPSPLGLVLSGLASCTAITLRMYAERKGWPLTGVQVNARYVDSEADPAGQIERSVHLDGDLDEEQRARLAEIAERTPVTRLIRQGRQIQTTVH